MRTMVRWTVPVEQGNAAVKNGSIARTIETLVETLKPEAAYFLPDDGSRTALFFFNMQDASQIPVIAEPLFMGLNASLTLSPVMNGDDLQKGLAEAAKHF